MSSHNKKGNLPERILKELMAIFSYNEQIEKVILFGSRARGDNHPSSDIDLAFYTSNLTHSEQNFIEFSIQEIPTHIKIDIVFMDRIKIEDLIKNIKKDGVVLYEQGKAIREA